VRAPKPFRHHFFPPSRGRTAVKEKKEEKKGKGGGGGERSSGRPTAISLLPRGCAAPPGNVDKRKKRKKTKEEFQVERGFCPLPSSSFSFKGGRTRFNAIGKGKKKKKKGKKMKKEKSHR